MNMINFSTGQLFDWFISGSTAFALIERLPTSSRANTSDTTSPDYDVGVPLDVRRRHSTGISPSLGKGEEFSQKVDSVVIGHGVFSLLDASRPSARRRPRVGCAAVTWGRAGSPESRRSLLGSSAAGSPPPGPGNWLPPGLDERSGRVTAGAALVAGDCLARRWDSLTGGVGWPLAARSGSFNLMPVVVVLLAGVLSVGAAVAGVDRLLRQRGRCDLQVGREPGVRLLPRLLRVGATPCRRAAPRTDELSP